ncbi:hypothetical protein [Rhodopirellula sp. MGV]|uniref:hypothetical protein n=1 Tax=Rhodopirellula sp. MGV TaxID=2023130 RepID=UPI000B96076A|nr:hypothetical protein [Rhodopirellula sp. MGV]OYP34401.1 hypothetical protein CGZ80_15225 [Rhodopirellula sp. MGV]PNY37424.1 hypothetical protein C2E31_07800 [Rhodopirellula baltica]
MRHAIRVALKDRKLAKRGHVAAEGVCRVLLELAVDHFAESGKEELIAWEFANSHDLGKFIFASADAGAIELSESDQLADFDGWFDLNQDPSRWGLQW